jgi:glycosyltransferase involved in cell wall biosynthesis
VRRVLFVGRGTSSVCWYRCALPATVLGADWIGVSGEPPRLKHLTARYGLQVELADFARYDVVILQQPRGAGWLGLTRDLQRAGVVVLYEVDDYAHAIREAGDHEFRTLFGADHLREMEALMGACDGVICSTDFIAERYARFNRATFVCRNGIDLARYALTRPGRDHVHLGWAGGMGHRDAVAPWLTAAADVMAERPATRFVSIGQPFARELETRFGAERCLAIPFHALESYPASMTLIDVAVAPSGGTDFFRGKSDLRWLEASALGIPVVADPVLYSEIEHGVTGFHAGTPAEVRELLALLVDDAGLRERVGAAAREHVRRERDIRVMARQWAAVLDAVGARLAA